MVINAKCLSNPWFNDDEPFSYQLFCRIIKQAIEQKEAKIYSKHGLNVKMKRNHVILQINHWDVKRYQMFEDLKILQFVEVLKEDENFKWKLFKILIAEKTSALVKDHPQLELFMDGYRQLTGSRAQPDAKTKQNFNKAIETYSVKDMLYVAVRVTEDPFHIENNMKYLTPEYVTRIGTINRYINVKPRNASKDNGINQSIHAN